MKRIAIALPLVFLFALSVAAQSSDDRQLISGFTLTSKVLGEDRVILVHVPNGYADAPAGRYPVFYMTDGVEHMLHTVGTTEFLARNNLMPPMIVVGIGHKDRQHDLTPTHWKTLDASGSAEAYPTSGGGEKLLDFIEKELIPWVDANYRTQPYRIFAGHSLGGLFAVHTFLTRPQLFQAVVAVSPSLQWEEGFELKKAREFFRDRRQLDRALFLTIGDEGTEAQKWFDDLRSILKKSKTKDFRWTAVEMKDEDHGSIVLRAHYSALRFVYDDWRMPVANGRYAGGLAGIRQHYSRLTTRFGYEVPIPENVLNNAGYQALADANYVEALDAFEENVRLHPASANVYDSLGEAYEKTGNREKARTSYAKAVEIGKSRNDPNQAVYQAHYDRVSK